jgi:hypothetical protein
MNLEVFTLIVEKLRTQLDKSHGLYTLGIDLMDYEEGWNETISLLLKAYYGASGSDWIEWYLYERKVDATEPQAWDKDGTPICYDIPSLWKCVEDLRVSSDFIEFTLPKKTVISQSDLEKIFSKKS